MSILVGLKSPGHVSEALYHFNHGTELWNLGTRIVDSVRAYSDSLNKLQSEWFAVRPVPAGEMAAFRELLESGLSPEQRLTIWRSPSLRRLIDLNPQVMNHKTLLEANYRPSEELSIALQQKARYDHARLAKAAASCDANLPSPEDVSKVLNRTADLLYVVRSNIAHGEKTVNGPDLQKQARDEQVCKVVAPVQQLLLDLLLDSPSTKLLIYGSLAPGERNHSVVANIPGRWSKVEVKGELLSLPDGLKSFRWSEDSDKHKVDLLCSMDLPKHWARLDEFEGERYARKLLLAQTEDGVIAAYSFVASDSTNVTQIR